ncbi:Mitochondrial transcription termination factor family protein [Euphorbia peplus]|nr:Mitochondrial transcription termination factor family protein [Euphorbia peplus]
MASKLGKNLIRNVFSQIHKRFLHSDTGTTSSSSSSSSSSFTVQFLVESCGLPLKSALSVSKKFQLDERNPQKPQSVLQFLKSHHFTDTQLATLIVRSPKIHVARIEKNLQPKFDYLVQNGLAGELLLRLIVSTPQVIQRSLDSHIKPCVDFLSSFFHSSNKLATAIMRARWFFDVNLNGTVRSNVHFLMEKGVPSHGIAKLILLSRVLSRKPETMTYTVNAVKNLGLKPNAPMFVHALKVMTMSASTWEKKIQFMKSVGWNEEEILKTFNRFPSYLGFSEMKIKKAFHFYLDTMRLEREFILARPELLSYSIDKRMRPRFDVLELLKSKKLIEVKLGPLYISEKDFQKKYIDPYIPKVPGLLEMYLDSKESEKFYT